MLEEPVHVVCGEEEPLPVLAAGPVVATRIGRRVGEQLRSQRDADVARPYRRDGGEVRARAVACDDEPGRIGATTANPFRVQWRAPPSAGNR